MRVVDARSEVTNIDSASAECLRRAAVETGRGRGRGRGKDWDRMETMRGRMPQSTNLERRESSLSRHVTSDHVVERR